MSKSSSDRTLEQAKAMGLELSEDGKSWIANNESKQETNSLLFKKNLTIGEVLAIPIILFSLLIGGLAGQSTAGRDYNFGLVLGVLGAVLGIAILLISNLLQRKNN